MQVLLNIIFNTGTGPKTFLCQFNKQNSLIKVIKMEKLNKQSENGVVNLVQKKRKNTRIISLQELRSKIIKKSQEQ